MSESLPPSPSVAGNSPSLQGKISVLNLALKLRDARESVLKYIDFWNLSANDWATLLEYDPLIAIDPASVRKMRRGPQSSSMPEMDLPLLNVEKRGEDAARWLQQLDREPSVNIQRFARELIDATSMRPDVFVPVLVSMVGWNVFAHHRVDAMPILASACKRNPAVLSHIDRTARAATYSTLQHLRLTGEWDEQQIVNVASCLPADLAWQVFSTIDPRHVSNVRVRAVSQEYCEESLYFLKKFPGVCAEEDSVSMALSVLMSSGKPLPAGVREELLRWSSIETTDQTRHSVQIIASGIAELLLPSDRRRLIECQHSGEKLLAFLESCAREYVERRDDILTSLRSCMQYIPAWLLASTDIVPHHPTIEHVEWARALPKEGHQHPRKIAGGYRKATGKNPSRDVRMLALALTREYSTASEAFMFILDSDYSSADPLWTPILRRKQGKLPSQELDDLLRKARTHTGLRIVMGIHWESLVAEGAEVVQCCIRGLEEEWGKTFDEHSQEIPYRSVIPAAKVLARFRSGQRGKILKDLSAKGYEQTLRDQLEIAYAPVLYPDPASLFARENGGSHERAIRTSSWHVLPGQQLPGHASLRTESKALHDELRTAISDVLDWNTSHSNTLEKKRQDLSRVLDHMVIAMQSRSRLSDLLTAWKRQDSLYPPLHELRTAQQLLAMASAICTLQRDSVPPIQLKHMCLDRRWIEKGAETAIDTCSMPTAALQFKDTTKTMEQQIGMTLRRRNVSEVPSEEYNRVFRAVLDKVREVWINEYRRKRRELIGDIVILTGVLAGIITIGVGIAHSIAAALGLLNGGKTVSTSSLEKLSSPSQISGKEREPPAADPTMPGRGPGSFARPESLRESPAIVGRLSEPLYGRDQYLVFNWFVGEILHFLEQEASLQTTQALSALGPRTDTQRGRDVSLDLTQVRQGSVLPLSLGAALTKARLLSGASHDIDTSSGLPTVQECEQPGPLRMDFRTAAHERLDTQASIEQVRKKLPTVLQPLLETSVTFNRLPAVLQEAVLKARRKPATQAMETIRTAVEAFLTYDDTCKDAYDKFLIETSFAGVKSSPYVEFICEYKRGDCVQFARLTMELLRQSGVPAVMARALWAQKQTITTNDFHRVAVAIMLDQQNQLTRVPVETSKESGNRRRQELAKVAKEKAEAKSAAEFERRTRSRGQQGLQPDTFGVFLAVGGVVALRYAIPWVRKALSDALLRRQQAAKAAALREAARKALTQQIAPAIEAKPVVRQQPPCDEPAPTQKVAPPVTAPSSAQSPLARLQRISLSVLEKPPPPPFKTWWRALVHEKYRESTDAQLQYPEPTECLLYADVRRRVLLSLKNSPYNLPYSYLEQAYDLLMRSLMYAKEGHEELEWMWLEQPMPGDLSKQE